MNLNDLKEKHSSPWTALLCVGDLVMTTRVLFVHGYRPPEPCQIEAIHMDASGTRYDLACTGRHQGIHLTDVLPVELECQCRMGGFDELLTPKTPCANL